MGQLLCHRPAGALPAFGLSCLKAAAAFAGAMLLFSAPSTAAVVVSSTLWDCDRSAQTTSGQAGAMFGTFGDCTAAPIGGFPAVNSQLQNGDFTVHQYQAQPVLGDGNNEVTGGAFDFIRDDRDNWLDFAALLRQPHGKVFGGTLTFLLNVVGDVSLTDSFNLGEAGIGAWGLPNRPSFTIGDRLRPGVQTLTLNLRDFYDVSDLTALAHPGRVSFLFQDDATIIAANLRLTADIPEPSALALLTVALTAAGLASAWGRQGRVTIKT